MAKVATLRLRVQSDARIYVVPMYSHRACIQVCSHDSLDYQSIYSVY